MKKVLLLLLLLFISAPSLTHAATPPARAKSCELKTFKVTAYYSPLEGQDFYAKGNLEDDKILNGEGTHGASGKPVFDGMIAAPKSYTFGTRLYIPGWGIGQIEDRGGAIVESGQRLQQYDRLDIRAGKGQEGLEHALRFGVRYFDAYVCPENVGGDAVGFDFSQIPEGLFPIQSLREINLQPGQMSRWVPILQTYLMKLGYLGKQEPSVNFDDTTKTALCTYQKRVMGLKPASERCGWFGPQTRESMSTYVQQLANSTVTEVSEQIANASAPAGTSKRAAPKEHSVAEHVAATPVATPAAGAWLFGPGGEFASYRFSGVLKVGDTMKEVRILQRKLQRLGFYPVEQEITGIYDDATIRAVFAFQLQAGILETTADPELFGYFGPKTRAQLNEI